MSLAQKALYLVAGLVAAILQLLFEAAFGPSQARKGSQRGHRTGNAAYRRGQPDETREQDTLSGEALVRLCRGLQEEVRRKEGELTICKASPATSQSAGHKMPVHTTHKAALSCSAFILRIQAHIDTKRKCCMRTHAAGRRAPVRRHHTGGLLYIGSLLQ